MWQREQNEARQSGNDLLVDLAGAGARPAPTPMVVAAEYAYDFTGGDLSLLPLYAAIHGCDDPERIADLMVAARRYLHDAG